jgi:hypothetical protein
MDVTPPATGGSAAAACCDVKVVCRDASGEVSVIYYGDRMFVHSEIADEAFRLGRRAGMGSASGGSKASDVSEPVTS